MNPPSAVLGGGVHGKVSWLIAYNCCTWGVVGGGGAPVTLPYSTDNIVSMQVLIYAGSLNVTFTGFKERTFLLESYLRSHKWGHLEMHMLLSEDIIHFNVDGIPGNDLIDKNNRCPELLVSLLTSRCPVGRRVKSGLWGRVNKKWE